MLFIKKKDGSLQLFYQELNKVTVKNKYLFPHIDNLFNQLQGSQLYSKINLQSGYHQLKIKTDNVPMTSFRTHYGHFEFNVMSFGLTNAPTAFMDMMDHISKSFLDNL